jgi:hypothetical protein
MAERFLPQHVRIGHANYHAVQTYHPRETDRSTFFARASSYLQPTAEYGRLEPVPNERMDEDDWLAEIADGVADTSLALNSWTVGCHDSRLGMANRDLALETPPPRGSTRLRAVSIEASGTALPHGARHGSRYADPIRSDRAQAVRLLLLDRFGWHHQKTHVVLGDLGEFLFGLCFYEACRANAADAGIDVERARTECVETLDRTAPIGVTGSVAST